MQPLELALLEELRGRFLNPQWLKPLMQHGYGGARTMGSEFMEYLWGWQVTNPDIIRSWVWDEVKQVYLEDSLNLGLDEFLEQGHNVHVKINIQAILLVAADKGFWQADSATLKQLAEEFARRVAEHGLPGSGHTDPHHPMMKLVEANLDEALAKQLLATLAAAKGPQVENEMKNSITTISEISVTPDNETQNRLSTESQQNNPTPLAWPLPLLLLTILAGGVIQGRRGVK